MPSMKGAVSIAANATNANVLDGQDFEFLPFNALVSVALAQSATGLEADVKSGAESLAAGVPPNIVAATGRIQQDTDTILTKEAVPKGKRLKLVARNTTGGALTLFYVIDIDQLFLPGQ